MNTTIGNKDARHRNNNRLYGGGFPSKCLDKFVVPGLNARSQCIANSPLPLPNCGTPILLLPPRVSEHSAVPTSYGVHSCALFMVRFLRYVQYWSSMTDKRRRIIGCKIRCRWAPIYGSVQTLSDTNGGFAGTLARWYLSWCGQGVPLSLSHWCWPTLHQG